MQKMLGLIVVLSVVFNASYAMEQGYLLNGRWTRRGLAVDKPAREFMGFDLENTRPDNHVNKKELPQHPASIPDGKICHLARLPNEILKLIVEFVIGQTNHEFLCKVKHNKTIHLQATQDSKVIQLSPIGEQVYIDKDGNLKIKKFKEPNWFQSFFKDKGLEDDALIKVVQNNGSNSFFNSMSSGSFYYPKQSITQIAASKDNIKICALKNQECFGTPEKYSYQKLVAIYLINILNDSQEVLDISSLPVREKRALVPKSGLPLSHEDYSLLSELLGQGYTAIGGLPYAKFVKPYTKILVGADKNFVVLANATEVYVAQKDFKSKKWLPFKLIKNINEGKKDPLSYMHIESLQLNDEENKIAITTIGNYIIIINENVDSLTSYFYKKGVCKNFMTEAEKKKQEELEQKKL